MPGRSSLRKYEFDPHAQEEFLEALRSYREEAAEVAVAFDAEVKRSVELLLQHPRMAPAVGPEAVRRKLLRRFPYSLFYVIEADRIRIMAVAHQSRLPGYWISRL